MALGDAAEPSKRVSRAQVEVAFLEQEATLVIRSNVAETALAYYRSIDAVHEQILPIRVFRVLFDGSAIKADLESDRLTGLLSDQAGARTASTGLRIAAVLDEALASLHLLFSLVFNRGHRVAVFSRPADALAWLRTGPGGDPDARARGGVRVWGS